jgi:hypothetical protein
MAIARVSKGKQRRSGCSSASKKMNDERNHGDQQQKMNQPASDMENQEAADPKDEKQKRDGKKWSESHKSPLRMISDFPSQTSRSISRQFRKPREPTAFVTSYCTFLAVKRTISDLLEKRTKEALRVSAR